MRRDERWLMLLGCLGPAEFAGLLWLAERTPSPPLPVAVPVASLVIAAAVGPWIALAAGRLHTEPSAGRALRRVIGVAALIAAAGTVLAALIGTDSADESSSVALLAILVAGALALVGAVLLPWTFLLARTLTTERAARARAEERAQVATHLHDSVLQALTLVYKRADDARAVRALTRATERDLRAWLYGTPPAGDDLATQLRQVAAQIEDRYDITVGLSTVGTCQLTPPAQAFLGAVGEALTNAARHAAVPQVSVYAEVADTELLALVRDRGRGFDPAVHTGPHQRGIADSIEARIRQHRGTATIRSAPGDGTEVELHMPLDGPR
ncbi:ATP-binding protein [Phytohabitans sp. ZYX-F-186]|uniref:ATP-binding protein n=1 Tax=Phytohabitans maris TaxID=3071409 RepID=A0ABU0Z9B7_9ACTN|nr:ATP-binding protein [Phytohabitans sp. ZYX-F-186]MDQ7903645.1 ATP-binding protein [Phytohabitans sp. ZYX-F-186]